MTEKAIQAIGKAKDFELDKSEYTRVLEQLQDPLRQCVLVSGSAGTGKTTFIEYLHSNEGQKDLPLAKNIAVVAPTGIAAMQAGGATIHSFFQFPPECYDYESAHFVGGEAIEKLSMKEKVFRTMELLVIDEISMVRADLMDAIDKSMRVNRGVPDQPFGGVKLLLVGDLFQLQPVVTQNDAEFLQSRYENSSGMFFFNSLVMRDLLARQRLAFVELKIARRFINLEGKNDNFYHMLNRIRMGDSKDLQQINYWLSRTKHWNSLLENNAVVLTGLRRTADKINADKLDELEGEVKVYEGEASGNCRDYDDSRLPAPRQLQLKKGAQIIFVRNAGDGSWYNGSLGYVEDFHTDPDDEDKKVIQVRLLSNDASVYVEQETWDVMQYKYDKASKMILAESAGSYKQFPFMLAWAMTVHRAQGKTIESVVIDLGFGAFSAGQAYVALSRCREAKNVGLRRPLKPSDIICHDEIVSFYEEIKD